MCKITRKFYIRMIRFECRISSEAFYTAVNILDKPLYQIEAITDSLTANIKSLTYEQLNWLPCGLCGQWLYFLLSPLFLDVWSAHPDPAFWDTLALLGTNGRGETRALFQAEVPHGLLCSHSILPHPLSPQFWRLVSIPGSKLVSSRVLHLEVSYEVS